MKLSVVISKTCAAIVPLAIGTMLLPMSALAQPGAAPAPPPGPGTNDRPAPPPNPRPGAGSFVGGFGGGNGFVGATESVGGGFGGGQGFGGFGGGMMMGGGTAITVAGQFIFVVQGNTLFQFALDDLHLVRQANLMPMQMPPGMPPRGGSGVGGGFGGGTQPAPPDARRPQPQPMPDMRPAPAPDRDAAQPMR